MGQSVSAEHADARSRELTKQLIPEAMQRTADLRPAATAEKQAGMPAAHGSKQALFKAADEHLLQLLRERHAIDRRLSKWVPPRASAPLRCPHVPAVPPRRRQLVPRRPVQLPLPDAPACTRPAWCAPAELLPCAHPSCSLPRLQLQYRTGSAPPRCLSPRPGGKVRSLRVAPLLTLMHGRHSSSLRRAAGCRAQRMHGGRLW